MDNYFDFLPIELNESIFLYTNALFFKGYMEIPIFSQVISNFNFWRKLFIFNNIEIMNKDIIELFKGSKPMIEKFSKYNSEQLFYLFL